MSSFFGRWLRSSTVRVALVLLTTMLVSWTAWMLGGFAVAEQPTPPQEEFGEVVVPVSMPGLFRAMVSTYNGAIRSFLLEKEQFHQKAKDPPQATVSPHPSKLAKGPLDMVSTWDAPYLPFGVYFEEVKGARVRRVSPRKGAGSPVDGPFANVYNADPVYKVVHEDPKAVTMVWPDPVRDHSDVFVERTWRVAGDYLMEGTIRLINLGPNKVEGRARLLVTAWQAPEDRPSGACGGMFAASQDEKKAVCNAGGELKEYGLGKLAGKGPVGMGVQPRFVGVDSRYFLLAAMPEGAGGQCLAAADQAGTVSAVHQWERFRLAPGVDSCVPEWAKQAGPGRQVCGKSARPSPGSVFTYRFKAYLGPKDLDRLESLGNGLEDTINFGFLSFLCKPMLWLLRFAHGLVPNWGLAIVFLTLVVKLLTIYPTQKSMQEMRRMEKLKPKVDQIREKYKDDKARQNQAIMELYKREKVNPFGGCLPMLIQLPFWIALYRTIYAAVDLYHAPLFLWIDDLSTHDPYFIMPTLLGVLMFVQQKLSPTAGDQTQAKILLYLMPVMFTLFMLFLPSGLVFYILVNTVLSITHQWVLKRRGVHAATTRR